MTTDARAALDQAVTDLDAAGEDRGRRRDAIDRAHEALRILAGTERPGPWSVEQHRQRRADATAAAEPWFPYLSLAASGYGVPAADRLRDAASAVQNQRQVCGIPSGRGEETILAVRVLADAFARQIAAAAGEDLDAATLAWVLAGLRCTAQPFCTGCTACQTVTSPLRPAREPVRGWR